MYVLIRIYIYHLYICIIYICVCIYICVYNCSTTVGRVDRYSVVNVHLRVLLYQSLVLRRKWECVIAVSLNSILRLPQGESSPCYTCNTGGYCIHRYHSLNSNTAFFIYNQLPNYWKWLQPRINWFINQNVFGLDRFYLVESGLILV